MLSMDIGVDSGHHRPMALPDEAATPLYQWAEVIWTAFGESQTWLAEACGIPQDYFNKILKEPRRQPSKLGHLAAVFTSLLDEQISVEALTKAPSNEVLKKLSHIEQRRGTARMEPTVDWKDDLVAAALAKMPGGLPELMERAAKVSARRKLPPRPLRRRKPKT